VGLIPLGGVIVNYELILDKVQAKVDSEREKHDVMEATHDVGTYGHGYHKGCVDGMYKVMSWIGMIEKGRKVITYEDFKKWCDQFDD
jgi:hypothetical protein